MPLQIQHAEHQIKTSPWSPSNGSRACCQDVVGRSTTHGPVNPVVRCHRVQRALNAVAGLTSRLGATRRTSWRQGILDEHEDGLLRADLYPLPDDVDELADGQISGHQIPVRHHGCQFSDDSPRHTSLRIRPPPRGGVRGGSLRAIFEKERTRTSSCQCRGCRSCQPSPR